MNFGAEDRIDVSRIDAGSAGGNQAFDFTGASGGAGDLRVVESGADAIVFAQAQAGARLVLRVAGAADHDWGRATSSCEPAGRRPRRGAGEYPESG
ncbi:hypothetical protein [Amaricoccus sp. W119]|uniref:hypothetical protein n=1 Tax=Amaricoccus sp. W119 TaxID=3391833 RepID=UPI0039A44F74